MKVEGGCHCGAIVFEAELDPGTVSICHCTDCQTLSGAPYRASVPVKSENLNFTKGAAKVYIKTAESGNRRAQGFCAECGAPIYSASVEANPPLYVLRVGAIAQRDQLIPKRQIWHKSALSWATDIAGIESHERSAPPPVKK